MSPVYGDFEKGFPPTPIQGGTREIFLSIFVRLFHALDAAGQTVTLGTPPNPVTQRVSRGLEPRLS